MRRLWTVTATVLMAAVLAVAVLTLTASRAHLTWSDPTGYAEDCLAVGAAVNAPGRTGKV